MQVLLVSVLAEHVSFPEFCQEFLAPQVACGSLMEYMHQVFDYERSHYDLSMLIEAIAIQAHQPMPIWVTPLGLLIDLPEFILDGGEQLAHDTYADIFFFLRVHLLLGLSLFVLDNEGKLLPCHQCS